MSSSLGDPPRAPGELVREDGVRRPIRPCALSSAPTLLGKPKWAMRSPCRWPISRRPARSDSSPRLPDGGHVRPRGDLVDDLLAGAACLGHGPVMVGLPSAGLPRAIGPRPRDLAEVSSARRRCATVRSVYCSGLQPRSPTRCCQVVGWIRDHAQSAASSTVQPGASSTRSTAPPQHRAQLPHPLAPGTAAVVAGHLERARDRTRSSACSRTRSAAGARALAPAAASTRPRPRRRSRSPRRGAGPSRSAARRGRRSGSRRAGARRRRRRRSRPP